MSEPTLCVRPLRAHEHQRLRELRLRSLAADGHAFGTTYQQAVSHPPQRWRQWAEDSEAGIRQRTFVLCDEKGRWLGLALVRRDESCEKTAQLNAMWVAPEARGQRAAAQLCDACASWAAGWGCQQLQLDVVIGNEPARRAYEAAGFAVCGATTCKRSDGVLLREHVMKRSLR